MASSYPTGLDSFATSRADSTTMATTHKDDHNNANDAINKIEAELGIAPSGGFTTVKARLDAGLSFNVKEYGAIGNGVADDTAAIAAAITAAGATGTVYSPSGQTYLISSTLTAVNGQRWSFSGSTIKKAASMTTNIAAAILPGNNYVEHLVIDGNRTGGAGGTGLETTTTTGNVLFNCTVRNSKYNAFTVQVGSEATFINCTATDVVDGNGGVGSANGFLAIGATRWIGCRASFCDRAGFLVFGNSGCELNDGYATRCGYGIQVPIGGYHNGRISYLVCENNNIHDAFFQDANKWTIDYYESRDASLTAANGSASALQMNNCDDFTIGTLVLLRMPGYGLALAGGSSRNHIGTLTIDQTGGWDSDPGLLFSGGAINNSVDNAFIRAVSWAVSFGEAAGSNEHNRIGTLTAIGCSYGAVLMSAGKFNRIEQVFARNCYTTDATHDGLVTFQSADATDNVISFIDHHASGTKPKYVVRFDATAVRNYVMDGFDRTHFVTADVLDLNGGNFVSPALGAAGTLRA